MLYVIVLLGIMLGLLYRNSKVTFAGLLILIWILLGWSSGNADYSIHLGRFSNYDLISSYTEVLYTYLMKIANSAGLTYQQFLPLVMLVYVCIIGLIALKLSKAPTFVLSLYLIFPACMEAVQIRYTIASAIVLLGFYFLFGENGRMSEIKYIVCVSIASLLHISTIVFLLFVPLKRLSFAKTAVYTAIVTAVLYLSQANFIIRLIARIPGMDEKTSRVLETASSKYTDITIIKTIFRFAIFFAAVMFLLHLLKVWRRVDGGEEDEAFIDNVKKINLFSIIILPLFSYSVDFYRIQQTLSLLNYCALSYYCVRLPRVACLVSTKSNLVTTKRRLSYVGGCVLMTIVNLYFLVLNSNNILTVFKPFFENNILFGGGR